LPRSYKYYASISHFQTKKVRFAPAPIAPLATPVLSWSKIKIEYIDYHSAYRTKIYRHVKFIKIPYRQNTKIALKVKGQGQMSPKSGLSKGHKVAH